MLKHVFRHVKHEELSATQKAALKSRLEERKRQLQEALAAVNQSLSSLSRGRKGRKKRR
jgi:hypothetical protein